MTLASRIFAALARLPPAETHRVHVERDLTATMPDGVVLVADRFVPEGGDSSPIVLLRSPYGREGLWGLFARVIAERGYQAVVQSCRGTFGSGGTFEPFVHEREDGLATLHWLAGQPWFGGSIAMFGPSYLGFVQWAVATDGPPFLKALAPIITASEFASQTYPGGGFALDTVLSWVHMVAHQEDPAFARRRALRSGRRDLERAYRQLPLGDTDLTAIGRRVGFYQAFLEQAERDAATWAMIDFSNRLDDVAAPTTLVAGWYDLFLPRQLADYAALEAAGRDVHLTVGPWTHFSLGAALTGVRESLLWFDVHVRGRTAVRRRPPVRIFVMGAGRWRTLPAWPPPAAAQRWYLQGGGRLAPESPKTSTADRYRYDPADPTPTVGGVVFGRHAGARDNRKLEARSDVLTFTSDPLTGDLEVIGPLAAELYARSSLGHTDFFVRLCDVNPRGRSINVADGAVRVAPSRPSLEPDGSLCVRIELWPTAYRFRRGHRLRVQVSSGAHPRIARNLGTGEPLMTGTTLRAADQEVFHDPDHPSSIVLPVTHRV